MENTGLPTVGCYGNQQYRGGEHIHGNIRLRLPSNNGLHSNTSQYSKVRIGKHLSDRFPTQNGLTQGETLSSLLLNFALEYVIRKVHISFWLMLMM
jgi:hypothetical protein